LSQNFEPVTTLDKNYNFLKNLFQLRPTSSDLMLALELDTSTDFGDHKELDVELIMYPYRSGNIDKSGVKILPYNNYLEDLANNQKTLYAPILTYGANIFGLLLGFGIAIVYGIFNQDELFSLQSIVAIIGVYLVGKEIWGDLEQFLIDLSEKWKIRYYPNEYSYGLRSKTTLDQYADYSRSKKNKKELILAQKLDFISRSNASDIKLSYNISDLESTNTDKTEKRLAIICFDKELLNDFEQGKFLISTKVTLCKSFLGINLNHEFFQAIDGSKWGCLDSTGNWTDEASFEKVTLNIGRVKVYLSEGIIKGFRFFGGE
jgi:hypothetical protein